MTGAASCGTLPSMIWQNVLPHKLISFLPWCGLGLLLLLYLTAATRYLTTVPPLEGFDAVAHMNAINFWRHEERLPTIDLTTNEFSYELLTQPPLYYATAAVASRWLPYADAHVHVQASANRYFPGLSNRQSIDLPTLPQPVARAMLVARLISLLGGFVTVATTWLWIAAALPTRRWLPTAVAAVVAFNPLFLFVSTSITNDAWAAAGTVSVIWLMTVAAARQARVGATLLSWTWLFTGAVAGLAALTKYSGLLVAVPALVILVQYRLYSHWRRFGQIAGLLLLGAALTAGSWYGRNLLLYGELVPLRTMSEVITTLQRPTLLSWAEVWALLPFLFHTYWGLFLATFAPARLLETMQWAVVLAGGGLLVGGWRHRRHWLRFGRGPDGDPVVGSRVAPAQSRLIWLALIWLALTLLSMINYMRLIAYGEQARFLLPAAPALGLLLVLGWQGWVPRRFGGAWQLLLLPLGMLVALWPLSTLQRAYALPPVVTPAAIERPVDATFAAGPMVAGYSLPDGLVLVPGKPLPIVLYFTAAAPLQDDYTLFLHLVDDEDRLLYQYDGVPFAGRHPLRQWQPGKLFADTYALAPTTPVLTDTLGTLVVGFYRYERPTERLPVHTATGALLGDRLILDQLRVLANPPHLYTVEEADNRKASGAGVADGALATWTGGIELVAAAVDAGPADRYQVELTWRTHTLLATDYTVFIQFLDARGEIVAQLDQQPRQGQAPTSTWLVGEVITDRNMVAVPSAWDRVIVGVYDARSGERVPRQDSSNSPDFFVLPTD